MACGIARQGWNEIANETLNGFSGKLQLQKGP
jgi:hypothetical protein